MAVNLMPGEIDPISRMLGQLEASGRERAIALDRMSGMLEDMNETMKSTLKTLTELKPRVDRIEPVVEKLDRAHERGRGARFTLSAIAGALTSGGTVALLKTMGVIK